MLEEKPLIIGIAGAFGSGKSTVADLLENLGFMKISLAQFPEEEFGDRIQAVVREEI